MHSIEFMPAAEKIYQCGRILVRRADRQQPRCLTALEHRGDSRPLRGQERQTHSERLHQDDRRRLGGVMGGEEKHVGPGIGGPLVVAGQLAGEFHHCLQFQLGPQVADVIFKRLREPLSHDAEAEIALASLFFQQGRRLENLHHPLALLQAADKQHGQRSLVRAALVA